LAKTQLLSIKEKTAQLIRMKEMVYEAERILAENGDIRDFGRLLDESWQLKRGLTSEISTGFIDGIYAKAKQNGAIGGKLLGAGGGGFMALFAEPEAQSRIRDALSEFVYVPFTFENEGSKIIHYTPEENDYYRRPQN
jgi:D-glycero-alpha-D-manno-heptose-7-phosphate kinase